MYKDIFIRAVKTFVEAFIGTITIDCFACISDSDSLKRVLISTGIAGVSAGVSAVWNMLTKKWRVK